ncbi:MAG: glycoside hydrolase family 9 protein, partial [Bacteroidales bacterium]|nr:glycoside hydrolase family 9 protein [Bacteroidales bacterium]
MKSIRLFSVIAFLCMSNSIFAQNLTFTNDDYKKALWMTTRFYGAQRSGNGPNWLLCYHEGKGNISPGSAYKDGKSFIKDADGNYDLSGGWFDCGDHVKFGQTEFYSAYMLLLGYSEFPAGYDDYYSFDYSGYRAAKDYSWAGKKGKPNGIPDILDEVKYATDYFQKVIRDKNTFYYQVGDGDADHKQWVTSSKMSTLSIDNGGESSGSRKVLKATGSVTSMASLCGATLAAMARLYKPFDPTYAAACLSKALVCYDFVTGTTKGNTGGGSYYPSKTSYNPDMTVFFAELYRTTGESKYLTAAESAAAYITGSSTWNHNWSISYNNTEDLGFYLMAVTNSSIAATAKDRLKYYTETLYKPNSGYLLDKQNDKWGILRYPANQSLIYALYDKLQGKTTVNPYVAASIDHILGNNTKKLSFVVGFTPSASGYTHAKWPHHRNYYGSDANNAGGVSQQSGLEFGFMCGAQSFDASTYPDNLAGYEASEGGIDYNAGLVGALGYINSIVAPVNINKFGHPTPELGEAKSLCGTGSATLTATVDMSALASGESVTYKWYKGTATTPFEQGDTKTSVSVTSADTYRCDLVEKSGKWTTSGTVVVTATLPDVTLGSDVTLCTETSKTFDAVVSGTGITYTWKKDNATIAGATAKTYTAYTAGTYSVIVAASGCTSKTASAKVTSQLPQVQNDTICKAGTANLAVVTSGTYDWYDVATGGTKLASGSTYAPSITANKTYYVQDASSVSASVGPKTATSNTSSNWGISEGLQLAFTVNSSFSINSLKAMVYSVYSAGSGTITIEILDGSGNSFSPKKTFTSNATNVTTTGLATFTFSNFNIDKAWGSNLRMRLTAKTINGDLGFNESGASYPYNSSPQGVVTITGSYGSNSNAYMYFYDWQISAGSTCSRTPVLALIDGTLAKCALDTQAPTQPGALAFSNVEETSVSVAWTASTDNKAVTGYEVSVNGVLKTTVSTPTVNLTGLTANTEYSISVVAIDAAGNKSTARTGTVSTKETPDTQAPTQPGALAFSNVEETSVSVAWTAST